MPCRAALVALLVAAGCGVPTDDEPRPIAEAPVVIEAPEVPSTEAVPNTSNGRSTATVELFFIDGEALTPIEVELERPVDIADVMDALLEGPVDPGETVRSALVSADIVQAVAVRSGVAHVDLAETFVEIGASDQTIAVAQIVYTMTGRPGVGQVRLTLEGEEVEVPTDDGSLTSGLLTRADYRTFVPLGR